MSDKPPPTTLAEYMKGKTPGPFKIKPFYCATGDFMAVHFEDESAFADQVTPEVTLLRAFSDKRVVGVKVFGVNDLVTEAQLLKMMNDQPPVKL